jgi:hypothetical protein
MIEALAQVATRLLARGQHKLLAAPGRQRLHAH